LQWDGLAVHSGMSIGQSRNLLRGQGVEEREMRGDEVDIGRTIARAPFVQAREADFVHPEGQYEGIVTNHALRQAISDCGNKNAAGSNARGGHELKPAAVFTG
jgi:hypothetical protein